LGTNLGVVAAYNLAHAETAGYVYIAQILAGAAVEVSTIATGVLLPHLVSSQEPDAAAIKAHRLALAASAPLAAALVTGAYTFCLSWAGNTPKQPMTWLCLPSSTCSASRQPL